MLLSLHLVAIERCYRNDEIMDDKINQALDRAHSSIKTIVSS